MTSVMLIVPPLAKQQFECKPPLRRGNSVTHHLANIFVCEPRQVRHPPHRVAHEPFRELWRKVTFVSQRVGWFPKHGSLPCYGLGIRSVAYQISLSSALILPVRKASPKETDGGGEPFFNLYARPNHTSSVLSWLEREAVGVGRSEYENSLSPVSKSGVGSSNNSPARVIPQ